MTHALLHSLESLSLPGRDTVPNEDRCGTGPASAFVVDGAGGLGDNITDTGEGSDAAWLAELARRHFKDMGSQDAVGQTVHAINTDAGKQIRDALGEAPLDAWRQPVAGFLLVRAEAHGLAAYGLGDCVLFATDAADQAMRYSPMPDHYEHEGEAARAAIKAGSTLSAGVSLTSQGTMLTREEAWRARYNTAGGPLWTLGIAPEAANHLRREPLDLSSPVTGLLCTDGFAALVDRYGRYTTAGLVDAARTHGLAALGQELRSIEHHEDPDGLRYPRMKQSDDATAVLFEVS